MIANDVDFLGVLSLGHKAAPNRTGAAHRPTIGVKGMSPSHLSVTR